MGKIVSHEIHDLKNKSTSFSFGVGRENMKKMHVDQIFAKNKDPGPGQYARFSDFSGIESVDSKKFKAPKKP